MRPKRIYIPFSEEDVMRDARHLIGHLRTEYLCKYHTEPRFVKIPVWLNNLFVKDYESRLSVYPPPDLRYDSVSDRQHLRYYRNRGVLI